jgi:hypothetical protein
MERNSREDGTSGACFIIELPLGKEHLKDSQINSDYVVNGKKQQRGAASRNSKILLVDDDIEICRYLKSELSDWYRFVICNNGKEALKQLLSGDFDLVVSDMVDAVDESRTVWSVAPGRQVLALVYSQCTLVYSL